MALINLEPPASRTVGSVCVSHIPSLLWVTVGPRPNRSVGLVAPSVRATTKLDNARCDSYRQMEMCEFISNPASGANEVHSEAQRQQVVFDDQFEMTGSG